MDVAANRPRGRLGRLARRAGALPWRTPPQMLFVIGAVTQYVGSGLAVLLFARVPAVGVAWLRVLSAAVVLVAWRRPWAALAGVDVARATRVRLLVAFGLVLVAMNTAFYLAIDRLPLGTAVAIEFIGPIAVTLLGSRTRRDAGALLLATAGVVLLSDVHLAGSPAGVVLALVAGVMWGAYIVLGHRVAADPLLGGGRGLAGAMAVGALALAPFAAPAAAKALLSPGLLAACVGVGLASSVVPYALDQVAMARLPRARFALLLALLPATATLVGIVVLGQVPSPTEVVGIGCVVAATGLRSHADAPLD